ncbi:hypothetical protein D9M69_668290 [compost metagenome]
MAAHAVDHGDGFDGRIVVQTEDDQIGLRHEVALGFGVFAALRRDAQQFDSRHALQALANLQTGGAGFAVDEDLGHDAGCLVSSGSEMRQYNYALCGRVRTHIGASQHDTFPGCCVQCPRAGRSLFGRLKKPPSPRETS